MVNVVQGSTFSTVFINAALLLFRNAVLITLFCHNTACYRHGFPGIEFSHDRMSPKRLKDSAEIIAEKL